MKNIDVEIGKALFERVYEASEQKELELAGRFLRYRQIMEDLFKELTRDENQFFSSLFARTEYVFKMYETPVPVKKSIDRVRRLANQVMHNSGVELSEMDEPFSIRNLCIGINHFSQVPIPKKLRSIYENHLANYRETAKDRPALPPKETYSFYAVITDILPANDNNKGRILNCENDEFGAFRLWLWNNKGDDNFGSDLTPFADLAWSYARVYVTEVKKYPDKYNEFFATGSSLIVLEPDYLIEVKNLAECIQFNGSNPAVNLLGRFTKGEITESQIIGSLTGAILDDSSRETNYSFKNTFEKYMRANGMGLLVVSDNQGMYDRTRVTSVFENTRAHEPNILYHVQAVKDKKVNIEPTFISAQFGLLGRLDAFYEDPKDPNRKDVLELKSGSPPATGMWKNHEAQTVAYDLLLTSVFPERKGISSILYSKPNSAGTAPLRFVPEGRFLDRQSLLMLRNEIVANEIKLSLGKMAPLKKISHSEGLPVPPFLEADIIEFNYVYRNLNTLERAYFEEYVRFLFKELRIAKMGSESMQDGNWGFASLWRRTKMEKIDNYDVLVYLTIRAVSENRVIELEFPQDSLFSSSVSGLRVGDSVVLYPTPDPEALNPLHSQILKGTLSDILQDSIQVTLFNKQVDEGYFKSCHLWAVERDLQESGYRDMLLSLFRFIKSAPDHKALVFGQKMPQFEETPFRPNPELNDNQNSIIRNALNAQDYFLIQGPPGTGKTSTVLKEIILRLLEKGESVMILAFTNRAVDEICRMLEKIRDLDFIRLGRGEEPYCWQSLAGSLHLSELHQCLSDAKIVVSTQASFASNLDLLKIKSFDTLVVDEASQLVEPQLVGFLSLFRRFLLIGDENQLSAVVLQDELSSSTPITELHGIELTNLRESLFARLLANAQKKNWPCYGLLTHHYRMHEEIAGFVNRAFYGGKLIAGLERQRSAITTFSATSDNPMEQKLATNRILFIPSPKEIRSKTNEFEAQIASQAISLVQQKFGPEFALDKTVGVITPFRAQMATIRKTLGKELLQVSVDTVERYQGSERDIIILSYALRNQAQLRTVQSIGPNGVDRKLNVALSRAKEFLIITGCEKVLRKSVQMADLLDEVRDKGGYLTLDQQVPAQVRTSVDTSDLF